MFFIKRPFAFNLHASLLTVLGEDWLLCTQKVAGARAEGNFPLPSPLQMMEVWSVILLTHTQGYLIRVSTNRVSSTILPR